ncbi:cupin domain-containing protein [Halorussus gelatinilyticus]|uniref:Cupin domain-containing protein n=1 Tax=Halorussus gelatinilyticus TaxID=2937524 RepID=A0A8U0IKA1_9EURY|nr:cupin domain-containing protein [Halorussus gelatinilyticus]UPW01523.1 cupin domain-containing protein [Halorussus gelatinilyticus]
MEKVRIEEVESSAGPADVKRPLTRALGATDLAVNYYELAPGDSFAFGYHAHGDQEEVFYVASGTVTFETADGPVAAGPDEAVRFAPGEFQRGVNEGDERVVALALGAPKESGDLDLRRDCPDCGERTPNRIERADDAAESALVTVCEDCGAETGQFS